MSLALTLALALRHPRNITDGALIDTAKALSDFNKKEFHHVYPRAYLKRMKTQGEHNANGNICMLTSAENKKVSDDDPNKYLPELIEGLKHIGADPDVIFDSNLLPLPSAFQYAGASYEEFLLSRADLISEYVKTLCDGNY